MKFLADMGVSMSTIASLREAGHDAVHLRDQGLLKMEDPDILDKARAEDRIRSRGEHPRRSIPRLSARPTPNHGYRRTRAD